MFKTDLNICENLLKELFKDSQEPLLIIGQDKNILHINNKAINLLGNDAIVSDFHHLFSFDVCILDKENILNYTPVNEALWAPEKMKAEVQFQAAENEYKNFLLRSFKNNNHTIIILSDTFSQQELQEKENKLNRYSEKISELEAANKDFSQLQERAQSLAIRTGLINRISNSIRDSLELEKIIEIALKEISTTLGLDKSYFALFDEQNNSFILKNSWNFNDQGAAQLDLNQDSGIKQAFVEHKTVISNIMTGQSTNHIQPRLVTPVLYRDKALGVVGFYHLNNKIAWHEEEISLIEGLTSQLASAINQAELFNTILSQKNELEQTLLQLKETQAQLIQSEKMASLGQLVAGVAHEINTPLGSVNSNNNIFKKCIERIRDQLNNPDIIEILEEAINTNAEAIKRINGLVKSLRNFARLDEAQYQEADIHEGIKSTLKLINHETRGRVEITTHFGEIPAIKCYPNQLNQVFMNILVNAYQSIEGNGTITIKTHREYDSIIITITDTGKGIPAENLAKIFDPGFTTKGVGVGTGLGLSICYQIIEKHKGKISADSQVGKGTTFKIELPLMSERS